MSYDLDRFCRDCHDILRQAQDDDARARIAANLERLLANPAFVAETWREDTPPGKRELYHDPETGVYVLAHVQRAGKGGQPHSHGDSWAIYGNARGFTDMTEWERVNDAAEDHAELRATDRYRIGPGEVRAYGPGVIHSTAHPEPAWVVRITGGDLDVLPRYRFDPRRDKVLAEA